ncbi:MAG: OB-fold domain-containing protein [Actinomycetota bacterium]|nr:OB-fold domain-containing protein [Actinomycetota bacterium]
MAETSFLELPITIDPTRPLPGRHEEDIEYLNGAARGELRMPWCNNCQTQFWPSGPVCRFCFGRDIEWVTDPGAGTVNAWIRGHKAYFEGDQVPYVVVQVTLDSGPRLTTSWTGQDDPVTGEPVAVSFLALHKGEQERWVPQFGPR